MESWQVIYLAVIFAGLVIGWRFGPLIGFAIIVTALPLSEVLQFRKSSKKVSSEESKP
jgi:hypothetical protein